MCFMRICDYKFAVYGFFAEHRGITSGGKSFNANVSAVLSNMNHERHEVQADANGWVIAPAGRQAWAHIRTKRVGQQEPISSNVQ